MNYIEKIKELFRQKKVSLEDVAYVERSQREIEMFEEMKLTEGWKELSTRLRQELRNSIMNKVKDDPEITTLLRVLSQADTKSARELLQAEVDNIIP